ncbi:MAG: DUF5606 domain-containing protein [Candidatus Symbiothrix sp.]|jgi:hypothetical protein|nr:DUF5606 domain-containing protein [Candidatus Symbiothrix sp.]
MLKEILSVSGKPGLFKLISKGKNMFIAESLIDRKRIPVYMRDKVVSLGDISIYTTEEEVPLAVVLNNIKEKENGQAIAFDKTIKPEELKAYFETVLPDFDKERVYPSDIKKLMNWYNLLVQEGLTDFSVENEENEKNEDNENNELNENNEGTEEK